MGKAKNAIKDFIENIPDNKLIGLPSNPGTIYSDTNLRLDMQGVSIHSVLQ